MFYKRRIEKLEWQVKCLLEQNRKHRDRMDTFLVELDKNKKHIRRHSSDINAIRGHIDELKKYMKHLKAHATYLEKKIVGKVKPLEYVGKKENG